MFLCPMCKGGCIEDGKSFLKRFVILMLPTLIAFIIAFGLFHFVLGIAYLSFTKFTTVTDAQWIRQNNYIGIRIKDFLASLLFTVKFGLVNLVTISNCLYAGICTSSSNGTNISEQLYMHRTLRAGVLGYI